MKNSNNFIFKGSHLKSYFASLMLSFFSFQLASAQTYCASKGTLPWEYWINNVTFNSISNTSDKFKDYNTLGYSDYSNVSTNVTKGQTYGFSVNPGTSWSGLIPNTFCKAWIDFNKNGIFENSEEILQFKAVDNNPIRIQLTIPTTATTGATRIRVSIKADAYATACETFAKGEVEDYTINIQDGVVNTCTNDVTPPVFKNCPVSFSVTAGPCGKGACGSNPTWIEPTVTDNCTSTPTVTVNYKPGTYFLGATGVVQIIYTASDTKGNTSQCTFGITSTQVQSCQGLPDASYTNCPANITVNTSSDSAIVNYTPPTLINVCGVGSSLLNYIGNKFPVGTTVVHFTGFDNQRPSLSPACEFTVTVVKITNSCRTQDSLELVKLYNTSGGSIWNRKWDLTKPINTWDGITLNANGCVVSIVLSSNNLYGPLPSLNFPNVVELFLNYNKLMGNIPVLNMPSLTSLNLSDNQLNGTISNLNLPNLISLYLYNNQLTGSIPNFNLPKLERLSLTNNKLTGAIPNFNMPVLVSLTLGSNQLSGTIPNFSNSPNLFELFLGSNQLSGTIPNFNLPKLFYLYLNNNLLSGNIPSFNLPSLTFLVLNNNLLSGNIPNFNLPLLQTFLLNSNQLTGSIPNFNLPSLNQLSLGNNQLTGSLPSFNLPNLFTFDAINNQLSGCIPVALKSLCGKKVDITGNPALATQDFAAFCANNTGACVVANSCRTQDSLELVKLYNATGGANWIRKWDLKKPINTWAGITLNANGCVVEINLGTNNLVGTLPNLNFQSVVQLYLYNNKLMGNIPVLNLPNLTYLDLTNNQLNGTVPDLNLPSLIYLYLNDNQFTGAVPNFNLPNLRLLALFNNQLTGLIPNFSLLPKIRSIDLSNNKLTGSIPNFNNLPILITLSLVGNKLSGTIPNFNLPFLEGLFLDFNQLSGAIPSFNLPSLTDLTLFSNQLTGSIPNLNTPLLKKFELSNNQLSGCLPQSLKAFCGKAVAINGNPNLATQDFAAFCANNTGACVNTALPDFRITSITETVGFEFATHTFNAGLEGFGVYYNIVNDGLSVSSQTAISTKFYLSKDTVLDASDVLWTQLFAGVGNQLAGGKTPLGFPIGDYYIIAKVNADNAITESNVSNNIFVYKNKVRIRFLDFGISITSAQSTYRQFSTNTFRITLQNKKSIATNISLTFPFPPKTVSGGNAISSTPNSTWSEWCSGGVHCFRWDITYLALNETATLDVPVYVQDATGNITATVDVAPEYNPKSPESVTLTPATGFLIGNNSALAFSASADFDKVSLTWLSNQSNVDYYEVQRAAAASDFQKIATQPVNKNNSPVYNFSERALNEGEYFYRIKSVASDGSEKLSDIQTVRVANLSGVQVFPNPATDDLTISLKNYPNTDTKVLVYDNLGLVVKTLSLDGSNNNVIRTAVTELSTGNYYVRVISNGKRDVVQRFVITR